MQSLPLPIHGRGTSHNPRNRFERLDVQLDPDSPLPPDEACAPGTVFLKDTTRTLIAHNDSPDVGFDYSINPYRGCEHGCIYCFARPTHEYLGFSAGLDFETRIMVKTEAPVLLRRELSSAKWTPQTLGFSGVTDPYQPIERSLRLTRRCLEVLADCRNPVCMITKGALVTRDIDVLSELARYDAALVMVSVTTLDAELSAKMEPRAAAPRKRLEAIERLAAAGIAVGVMTAPVIPGLTDHEMPAILQAAADRGARTAGYVPLRLPYAVAPLFERWLAEHYSDRQQKVLNRIRSMRDGKLNDPNFTTRMRGSGVFAQQMREMFKLARRRSGLEQRSYKLTAEHFRRPVGAEPTLFG